MAIYYDYAMNHTQASSTALDPNTDHFVWLYDKLSDWANKSNGAVQMVTGPTDWQNSAQWPSWSNLTPCFVAFKLNGVEYDKGGDMVNRSSNIVRFINGGFSTSSHQVQRVTRPLLVDDALGYNDPANYVHTSYGQVSGAPGFPIFNMGTENYRHRPSDYIPSKTSHVLYSDKPGDQFFFYWFREFATGTFLATFIHRIDVDPDYPETYDAGWVVTDYNYSYPVLNGETYSGASQTYERYYLPYNPMDQSNTIGASGATGDGIFNLKRGWSYRDNYGALVGTRNDILISNLLLDSLSTYEVKGTKYVCLGGKHLFPYESHL